MNYYELLGIKKKASEGKIKHSYALLQKNIRTRLSESEQVHHSRLIHKIDEAYSILSDPQSRATYDSYEIANQNIDIEETEIGLLKNLQDTVTVFTAGSFSGHYAVPVICCCCLGPYERDYIATTVYPSGYGGTTTLKMAFPICSACAKHIREVHRKRLIVMIAAALAGAFCQFFLLNTYHAAISISSGVLISIALYYFISLLVRIQTLPAEHTCRSKPVKLISARCFQFRNWSYAQAFSAINNGTLKERYKPRSSHLENLFFGFQEAAVSDFFVLLMFTAIAMVLVEICLSLLRIQ